MLKELLDAWKFLTMSSPFVSFPAASSACKVPRWRVRELRECSSGKGWSGAHCPGWGKKRHKMALPSTWCPSVFTSSTGPWRLLWRGCSSAGAGMMMKPRPLHSVCRSCRFISAGFLQEGWWGEEQKGSLRVGDVELLPAWCSQLNDQN